MYSHFEFPLTMKRHSSPQEPNLWVSRSPDAISETDLRAIRSATLNAKLGAPDAATLLETIQALNLEVEALQVKGLHPKIEAAERQIVFYLMHNKHIAVSSDVDQVWLLLVKHNV